VIGGDDDISRVRQAERLERRFETREVVVGIADRGERRRSLIPGTSFPRLSP